MPKQFLFCLICLTIIIPSARSQHYDNVLNYALNNTAVNGVKIKTNLPFANGNQMPTLIIEGYNFGTANPIGLILTYYVYNGVFTNPKISSFGSFAPNVYLANEAGKVVIFIDTKAYFQRFNVRATVSGLLPGETAANFTGWTAVDEALSGTATATQLVPYQNVFGGKVGVGAANPQAGLHVSSSYTLPSGEIAAAILGSAFNHWTYFGGALGGKIRGSNEGYLDIETNPTGTNKTLYINSTSPGNIYIANGGGNVGIGTTTPGTYKLAVEGTLGARKIKVTQQATWADFVFEPDYQLPSLLDIEVFIKTNKHLPDIPTEEEVVTEGLDLGEMNKKLLQKIEELTLYLIEENKKNKQQTLQIQELKEEMKQLKSNLKE